MFKFSLKDLLWFTMLASIAVFAYLQNSELRKTKLELKSTQADLRQFKARNEKLSDVVGEALLKAGQMYAEGRESMKKEIEESNSVAKENSE
ncbi:MAG: hypothetical protein AAGA30_21850 [Planctomycetota bacterium]